MRIINYGNKYEIYENDLKTFDQLPAQTYRVEFNKMTGFYLKLTNDFKQLESKLYGSHQQKIKKVFNGYDSHDRALGVILSGDKGIGKSLFTQLLSEQGIKKGLPVIIIDESYPGLPAFLDTIQQECIMVFDEFEKIFENVDDYTAENDKTTQHHMLGLFDGMSQQKRMYVLTVNDVFQLSQFLLNRPGRFHYHIRFQYPSISEMEEYLKDKVDPKYHHEVEHVKAFGNKIKLNYDCLRAIAFELNMGYSFEDAISDLNIVNTDSTSYDLTLIFENEAGNHRQETVYNLDLQLFNKTSHVYVRENNQLSFDLSFDNKHIQTKENHLEVDGKFCNLNDHSEPSLPSKINKIIIKHKTQDKIRFKF